MSDWYDKYLKGIKEAADKLQEPKKDIPQNILWLKAHITRKITDSNIDGAFTFFANDGVAQKHNNGTGDLFGYTEAMVNHMLTYTFNAGVKSVMSDYEASTNDMATGLEKIHDILDELGYNYED